MTAREAARRWARDWERAWREHDGDAVAGLYAHAAEFRSAPFRGPQDPAAYATWAFADEEPGGEVRFGEPAVVGDNRAAVEYWAVVRDRHGVETTIAGVALLRFDEGGLVVEQRDYWHGAEGRHEPHGRWGA